MAESFIENQAPLPFIFVTTLEGQFELPEIFKSKPPKLSFFSPSDGLRMTDEDQAIVFTGLEPLPPQHCSIFKKILMNLKKAMHL